MADLGFEPIVSDLDDACEMPRVAFPGQRKSDYLIVQLHWQPETTSGRGIFEPMNGIELQRDTSYESYWLAGDPVGIDK